ncbi:hypothetical protein JCM8547_001071 [Rhodosporidiobolus lusitaniae]
MSDDYLRLTYPEAIDAITSFCEQTGVSLELSSSKTSLAQKVPHDHTSPRTRTATELRRTIAYLQEQVEKGETERNETALYKIKNGLQAFETERVANEVWEKV